MYKEYREMSRTDAVEALYQDMAARHRSRFRSIHVILAVGQIRVTGLMRFYRSLRSWSSKRLKISSDHILSNCSRKT